MSGSPREKLKRHNPQALRSEKLDWYQASKFHLLSRDGYYSIAKTSVLGRLSYGAWHRPLARGEDIPQHLAEFKSAADAIACCEQHNAVQRMKDRT